jgi:hypothetical protein
VHWQGQSKLQLREFRIGEEMKENLSPSFSVRSTPFLIQYVNLSWIDTFYADFSSLLKAHYCCDNECFWFVCSTPQFCSTPARFWIQMHFSTPSCAASIALTYPPWGRARSCFEPGSDTNDRLPLVLQPVIISWKHSHYNTRVITSLIPHRHPCIIDCLSSCCAVLILSTLRLPVVSRRLILFKCLYLFLWLHVAPTLLRDLASACWHPLRSFLAPSGQGRRLRFASGEDNYGEHSEPTNFLPAGG